MSKVMDASFINQEKYIAEILKNTENHFQNVGQYLEDWTMFQALFNLPTYPCYLTLMASLAFFTLLRVNRVNQKC